MNLDPKDIHNLDQYLAGLVQLAGVIARYHKALVDEGLTREEATILAVSYQDALIDNSRAGG